jgi:hypothetical protein
MMGFATADSVHKGVFAYQLGTTFTLDEVNEEAGDKIFSKLLTAMESGIVSVSKGKSPLHYGMASAVRFMGNPHSENQEASLYTMFDGMLRKISNNAEAFGSRTAGVLFGLDFQSATTGVTNAEDENLRRLALMRLKVRNMAKLVEVFAAEAAWLEQPLPADYISALDGAMGKCQGSGAPLVVSFLRGHKEARRHVRGMALRLVIALPDDFASKDDALDWLLYENMDSIRRIAELTGEYAAKAQWSYWKSSVPAYLAYMLWVFLKAQKAEMTWDELCEAAHIRGFGMSKETWRQKCLVRLQSSFKGTVDADSTRVRLVDKGVLNLVHLDKFKDAPWKLEVA